MKLSILNTTLAVCRLNPDSPIPEWASRGSFFSISKTEDELSLVCDQENVPDGVKAERNWKALKVEGPLDFGLTGILASLANPLAQAKVSIFAISTFDTDYVMVKNADLDRARDTLVNAGFTIVLVTRPAPIKTCP